MADNDNNEQNDLEPSEPSEPLFEDLSQAVPKNTEETLALYKKALEQEFSDSTDGTNIRAIAKKTKEEIAKHVPSYLVTMRGLSLGATSESVKFQATKWLLENALLPGGAGAKDTLAELLEEMESESKAKDTSTSKAD
jgi:hypothetical protein